MLVHHFFLEDKLTHKMTNIKASFVQFQLDITVHGGVCVGGIEISY